jgi:hypothetical protein
MTTVSVNCWKPTRAVYSFIFPETWNVIRDLNATMPVELFRSGTDAARGRELIETTFPGLLVPVSSRGKVNLDEIQKPVIARIVSAYREHAFGLDGFPAVYPTSGSSEGIFHLLAKLRADGVDTIHTLSGEYEGFGNQATNLGMRTQSWQSLDPRINDLPAGTAWFISNPSARNGKILPSSFLKRLYKLGHMVVLDLAYVGSTTHYKFDLRHSNVYAVITSFSKPYGTSRFRIGGFIFCRKQIRSLEDNKWFTDIERLLQALALAEKIGPGTLYQRYRPVQLAIVEALNARFKLGLVASDTLLLATLPAGRAKRLSRQKQEMIAPFKRGSTYRFCLTPYFEDAFPVEVFNQTRK